MKKSKFIRFCLITVVASFILGHFSIVHAGSVDPYGPKGKRFGVGIIAGDPTGLSAKGYVTERFAIDGIFSWSFVDEAFIIIGDLTYDFLDIPINSSKFSLPFYAGAGMKIGFDQKGKNDGETLVGVRVPVGVALQWTNYPIEVFFEVAPGIELSPESEFDVTGGIGVRFYFL